MPPLLAPGSICLPTVALAADSAGRCVPDGIRVSDVRQVPLIVEPDAEVPEFASVLADGTVAGRPYRFVVDTGAACTSMVADEYTCGLPVVGQCGSSGAFAAQSSPVVTVTGLAVGGLRAATLDVARSQHSAPQAGNLLGMDVLGRYACHFRLEDGVLELERPGGPLAEHELRLGSRGHPFVEVCWPGVAAQACWDTGSGPTVVDRSFWLAHRYLFEDAGMSEGTDSSGTTAQAPLLLMAESMIGGRRFRRHKVAVVDLSHINAAAEIPMDLILGYPALRQATWLFDFPARRWAFTG